MTLQANAPLGIFDSGIGGLTVARAVAATLPHESIIYFGDTLHLPYGDKSVHVIRDYVKRIADFLLAKQVKLILVACNSASAAAYDMLKTYVGERALLINVIDPVVTYLAKHYTKQRLGLIGTKLTVDSAIYKKRLQQLKSTIELRSLATPLLVPLIEEGFATHELADVAIAAYLHKPQLQNISALILGCTHYPLIKQKIADFYQGKITIIDAAKIVAKAVAEMLSLNNLLASGHVVTHHFYVSDYNQYFVHKAQTFFGKAITVEASDIFNI